MKHTAVPLAIVAALALISGCSQDATPSNKALGTATSAPTAAANSTPLSNQPSASGELPIELVQRDNGFSFPLHISEEVNGFVAQTFLVPGDQHRVAHLVRRMSENNKFQLDVVVVDTAKQGYKIYPAADMTVKDPYSVDSLARAYGFTKQGQLVLVQPKTRDDGHTGVQYDAVALDLVTGEITTIAANIVPDVSPSFYAKGWMSESGMLYLNSYSDGRLWSVNTENGQVRKFEGQFANEWPLFMLTASPDGNLFWHEEKDNFKLYDQKGQLLKVIPQTLGYHAYPAFDWSPDSRLAALAFTLSDSHDNVLGGEEAYIIAPEAVAFYDGKGDLIWDAQAKLKEGYTNIDWVGWLAEGDEGVLSWYRLERSGTDEVPRKADPIYALANVTTGKISMLSQADRLEDLESPVPVVNPSKQLLLIDRHSGKYWSPSLEEENSNSSVRYALISKPKDQQLMWAAYDDHAGTTAITRYSPANHAATSTAFQERLGDELQVINDNIVVDNKMNYRWIH
ncbi:hypothetical protein [Paenibacillus glycanilyticus]|uniref:Uncharacterized protein n=1 Tax=Paenibacillus glycanilyticus TaxID=126569 RepID=A0ABQ6GBE0_9BACL|nr:hypothetical protein [Paenibacillus glycanilyticus]GLX67565.1 hypothetical protein MU1_19100 [Paenibacillus glycanilyticus]